MARLPTRHRSSSSQLRDRLRQLPLERELTLSTRELLALVSDAQVVTVAAFVGAVAYECHCNYRMCEAQAVFTKRSRHGV
jgi:hypothetical protein